MKRRVLIEDAMVPMPDGVRLATDIARIDDFGRRPVLLVRSPYGRASLRASHDPTALARDGWVVVLQDVRGRWDSEGSYTPFAQEIGDGNTAVGWCASQPWSNGAVVMAGASYDGLCAWLAAERAPEALRAIAPTVTAPDTEGSWIRHGGALQLGFLLNWGLGLGITGNNETDPTGQGLSWLADWETTVRSSEAIARLASVFPPSTSWTDPTNPALPTQPASSSLATRGVPIFHLTGWFDIFVEGALDAYAAARRTAAGDAQRLVVGPWTHGQVFGTCAGEVDFGYHASGAARFPGERLDFLRAAVAGEPVPSGASIFLMGRNEWLELPSWPPPTHDRHLYLHCAEDAPTGRGHGALRWDPPTSDNLARWQHKPDQPVPTLGGRTLNPGLAVAGPVHRGTHEGRNDVVIFETDELTEEIVIAGAVHLEVVLESTTPTTDLTAALVDVQPDGRAIGVVDGIHRFQTMPGRTERITMRIGSTAMSFRPGHRIRLEVASSNHPAYDVTPAGDRALYCGPAATSRLVVPAAPQFSRRH